MDSQEQEPLDLDGDVDACCSCGTYAAFADAGGVSVFCTHDLSLPPLRLRSSLISQRQRATAIHALSGLQLGRQRNHQLLEHEASQTLLAVAGSWHGTLVWVLEEAYACAAAGSAGPAPLRLIVPCEDGAAAEPEAAACEAVQLSSSGLLAAGHNSSIVVWDLLQLEVAFRLEGHQGCVTALAFCPHQQQLLVSAGEDRTFKVWDLQAGQLLHDSAIIGAAVPSCLAVSPARSACLLCIGYSDASVRIFDLSQLPATCHSKQVVDASRVLQQVAAAATEAAAAFDRQQVLAGGPRRITAKVTGLQQQLQQLVAATGTGSSSSDDTPAAALMASLQQDGAGCILAVAFVQLSGTGSSSSGSCHDSPNGSAQLLQELLQPPPHLLVCARRGLLLLNLSSGEAEQCWLFDAEAGDVWASVTAAAEAGCLFSPRVPAGSVSQLQQPAAQQLLQKQRQVLSFRALPGLSAPAAACCFAAMQQQQQQQLHSAGGLLCLLAPSSGGSITVARLTAAAAAAAAAADSRGSSTEAQQLSVFQSAPLPANSPLRVPGRPSAGLDSNKLFSSRNSSSGSSGSSGSSSADVAAAGRATWSTPVSAGQLASRSPGKPRTDSSKPQKPLPADKPVTFHKQIKSAGYGFVQPKVRLGQAKPAPIKLQPGCSKGSQLLARQLAVQGRYPLDSPPPALHQPAGVMSSASGLLRQGAAAIHNGGILRVEFAGDGCRLLTGSSDHTARCLPLLAKHAGGGTTFVGHNGAINSICLSHSGEHLLTSSADRTARLWSCSGSSPLITFSGLHQPAAAAAGSSLARAGVSRCSSSSSGQARAAKGSLNRSSSSSGGGSSSTSLQQQSFLSEVTAARFFYLDELVLLATGNKLHIYRYRLADAPVDDDILRLKSSGSYRLAGSYTSSGNTIADVAAANSFLSTLVLLACSNRSIELVDAATLKVARVIPEAHGRPITRLVQPPASPFASHPREACELFASAAPDSLVRLWDVRSARCVRSFSGHKHSSQQVPIGIAFSPCMRFLATGSEDRRAAYLYDLRSGSLLHRLRPPPGQQADAVADVAFCPSRPLLVAACMNGQLCCYTDS